MCIEIEFKYCPKYYLRNLNFEKLKKDKKHITKLLETNYK